VGASSRRVGGNHRRRFDVGAPDVRQYADGLTEKHDAVLASVGAGNDKLYSYRYVLNGFAARLTPDQARKLRARKDVRNVWEDRPKFVETNATVRSPLAIRALPFAAPAAVSASGATGQSQSDDIRAQLTNSVADDPVNLYTFVQPTAGTPPNNVRRIPLIVPESTRYLRVALFNQNSSPGADLDLYLYSCPGFGKCTEEVPPSVEVASSDEVINLIPAEGATFITPGEYYVDVHGFNAPAGTATFQLFVWTVGANRGNATVIAPSSVTAGTNDTLTLNWQNLATGLNLGLITHTNGTATLDETVIEVTAP
jgi:hypothetical protein